MERLVPVHNKTNVRILQIFFRDKFALWEIKGSCVDKIWKSFMEIIFESIHHIVTHKILRKNSDPE